MRVESGRHELAIRGRSVMHYHGTPITPRAVLESLAGRNFCVSFAAPEQVEIVHRIGQSVMLDNGAFSVWKRGAKIDWSAWIEWAEPWLDHPTTWCVLPDSVTGGAEENDRLLRYWGRVRNGVPVWHMDEPVVRLLDLIEKHERVCFGSSGVFATVGSEAWHRRATEAWNAIDEAFRETPWVHMLRGMSLSGSEYPFASVDSTDVARNHNRPQNTARAMADRWDAMQNPARWVRVDQLTIEEAAA